MLRILKRRSLENSMLMLTKLKSPILEEYLKNLPSLRRYSTILSWIKTLENYKLVAGKYIKKDVKYNIKEVSNFKLVEVKGDIYYITKTINEQEDVTSYHYILEPTFEFKSIEGKDIKELAKNFVTEMKTFIDGKVEINLEDNTLTIAPNPCIGFTLYKEYDIDKEREEDFDKLHDLKKEIESLL
jgi:hypothetical protein